MRSTLAVSILVWCVWRSPVRYALKASTLSGAVLLAQPYAYNYDFAVIAIAIAYLARDQIDYGLLIGEQTTMITLFGASLIMVLASGIMPLGPAVVIMLLATTLRRAFN